MIIKLNTSKIFLVLFFLGLLTSCEFNEKKKIANKLEISNLASTKFKIPGTEFEYDFKRKFKVIKKLYQSDDFENLRHFQINAFSNKKSFYFTNTSLGMVSQYGSDFKPIKNYGNKGEGPKEFSQPNKVYVEKDYLLVHDFTQRAIKKVDLKDSNITNYSLKNHFYSPAFLKNNKVLLRWADTSFDNNSENLFFEVFDFVNGVSIKKIEINKKLNIPPAQFINKVYEGDFVQNNDYSVYFSYATGVLFIFNNNTLDFTGKIQTIDKTPPPKASFIELGGGMKGLVNNPSFQPFKGAVIDSQNNLFLLNQITNDKNLSIIDVYSIDDKKYIYSLKVPDLNDGQKARKIFKIGNIIIVYFDDQSIASYEFEN